MSADPGPPAATTSGLLFDVAGLQVAFGAGRERRIVVRDLSLSLRPGRCLAIVGESGSGKSVTARALVGLAGRQAHVRAERLAFEGRDLFGFAERDWRRMRGKDVGFVLQDALVSLDALRPVGREIGEALRLHRIGSRAEIARRVVALLDLVGVPDPAVKARQLPHELSGGQRQRSLIAAALALDPKVLIADEPTTALDVTVQAQVLDVLQEARNRGKALILISHDLAVVSRMADDVLVMRGGEVVERGPVAQVLGDPQHDYTRHLLRAVPTAASRGRNLAPTSVRLPADAQAPRRDTASALSSGPLVRAENLVKRFRGPDRVLRTVVDDVSFELRAGETLGVVGESGSGKSTLARMVLALETPDAGTVTLRDRPWSGIPERDRRPRRRDIGVVYQDPLSSFDPRLTVGRILDDSLHGTEWIGGARDRRVAELLDLVGLPSDLRDRHPLKMSGGQRQRVAIARALAPNPSIIVCDEPVSALDVSIQAQVLDLLGDLKRQLGVSYLFISHDLGVIHHLSDRVLVMKAGRVVESGTADDVLLRPRADYTKTLVAAVPRLRYGPPKAA